MMNGWGPRSDRGRRRLVIALAVALALALGYVDYLTGPLFSFTIFYLFPVALVAWYAGRVAAVLLSLGCVLIWTLADLETYRLHIPVPLDAWNALVRIGFFIIVSYTITAAREALHRERRLATAIQRRLLPSHVPRAENLDISTFYRPARDLSGDYFDVLAVGSGSSLVCIADVSGKGLGPALLMANLQAAVRVLAPAGSAPAEICEHLNTLIAANLTPERFISFFVARIDPDRRRLIYTNAGHNPPLLFRSGSLLTRLTVGGPVLGVVDGARYASARVDLMPGDRLILYTDGLTEATDREGEEFSEKRIIETVHRDGAEGAEALQLRLIDEVERFSAGRFSDDVTLIVVAVT